MVSGSGLPEGHVWVRGPATARFWVDAHGPCYTESRAEVPGLHCCLKSCWCWWAMLSLGAILMWVWPELPRWCQVCAATEGMSGSVVLLWPESMLISMVPATSEGLVWVHGPTVTGSTVCGLCSGQKPCPLRPQRANKLLDSDTGDCKCATEKEHGRLPWQPHLHSSPSPKIITA